MSITALALALATPASATPTGPPAPYKFGTQPFSIECDQTTTVQIFARLKNGPPFETKTERQVQRYRIDPVARTVTTTFAKSGNAWVEQPHTYSNVDLLPSGRVKYCAMNAGYFCNRENAKTEQLTNASRTMSFYNAQTIINLAESYSLEFGSLLVDASDGSYVHVRDMTEGKCRRI